MRPYRTLLRTLTAAWLSWGVFAAVVGFFLGSSHLDTGHSALWLVFVGAIYTQLAEYAIHRFPMHRRVPGLLLVRKNHLLHHRLFHGRHFQTQDPNRLQHAAGRWYGFPLLLAVHVAVFSVVFRPTTLMWFFFGSLAHYTVFEWAHWACHVEDNGSDRFLARIPWVRDVRKRQIEHHRRHHEVPVEAFNVTAPYLGDRLALAAAGLPALMVRGAMWLVPKDLPLASASSVRRGLAALLLAMATLSKAEAPHQAQEVLVSDSSQDPDVEADRHAGQADLGRPAAGDRRRIR